ncbi:hypothetical protein [Caniella muris]|uniref:hypothetical protein n=1 Tax=Caniella muris TaxID=2941502 RepID=UPI00203F338A|nr:hypothetical protein [Caniella muris]
MDLLDPAVGWPAGNLSSILVKPPQPGLVAGLVGCAAEALSERIAEVAAEAASLGFTEDGALPALMEVPDWDTACHMAVVGTLDLDDGRALACCVVVTPVDDPCRGACVPVMLDEDRSRILAVAGPWVGPATEGPSRWGEGLSAFDYGLDGGDGLPGAAAYIRCAQDGPALGCDGEAGELIVAAADLARVPGEVGLSAGGELGREAARARISATARLWSVLDAMVSDLHTPAPGEGTPWGPQAFLAELPGEIREALVWAATARWCSEAGEPMDADTLASVLSGRVSDLSEGPSGKDIPWWDLLALAGCLAKIAGGAEKTPGEAPRHGSAEKPADIPCGVRWDLAADPSCAPWDAFERPGKPVEAYGEAETLAEAADLTRIYLLRRGCEVLEDPWVGPGGRPYIEARDADGTPVLVSVRARVEPGATDPLMAVVDDRERPGFRRDALSYVATQDRPGTVSVDVVSIVITGDRMARLRHIVGAFDWEA